MSPQTNKITKEIILDILQYCEENNVLEKEACAKYCINPKSFSATKSKIGLTKTRGNNPNSRNGFKSNNCNHDAFKSVTNVSSYWAGFLAADGNISKDNKRITFGLKYSDIDTVSRFKEFVKSENKICIYDSKCKGKSFKFCSLAITSPCICKDLKTNFNIVPQKSLILQPPNIDTNFLDYYIKGYIDGDGCISFNKKGSITISMMGTFDVLSVVQKRFSEILGTETGLVLYKKGKVYSLESSHVSARKLFKHYYELEYGLKRKWTDEKYKIATEWIDGKTTKGDARRVEIYHLLKTKPIKEVADLYGCTIQNIYIITKSNRYKEITSILDAGEVSLEDEATNE